MLAFYIHQKYIVTLISEKNANFCLKLVKIGENRDHNIDPRLLSFDIKNGTISNSQYTKYCYLNIFHVPNEALCTI
jgi:hypothetical protein